MKRAASLFLLVLVLGTGACGKKKTKNVAATTPSPAATTAAASATPGVATASNLVFKSVHFELDRAELTAEATKTLADGAQRLLANPSLRIRVEGHADERGGTEYNLALSERRAQAIRTYLMDLGVQRERIETVAYGEEKPISTAHDEAAWAANRRGELHVSGSSTTSSR